MLARHCRTPYVILGAVFALLCFPRFASAKVPATFSEGMVSLNFDDGWKNFYTNALPILTRAKMTVTVYPVSVYVSQRRPQFMTPAQLRRVEALGHEVGAHTRYHVQLTRVKRTRADQEIIGSKTELVQLGAKSVLTFAYPYGVFTRRLRQVVKDNGFVGARTSSYGLNSPRSDRWLLKTRVVGRKTKLRTVQAWIDEAKDRKLWLIIVIHDVQKKPKRYGTTPETLQKILTYLKANHVKVVTNSEGLRIMNEIREMHS